MSELNSAFNFGKKHIYHSVILKACVDIFGT